MLFSIYYGANYQTKWRYIGHLLLASYVNERWSNEDGEYYFQTVVELTTGERMELYGLLDNSYGYSLVCPD